MARNRKVAVAVAVITAGLLGVGCATAAKIQNYDKVSLGMSPDQVLSVAGKPHRAYQMESTGQGTVLPTPAGTTESWFYESGLIQFYNGKVVAKGQRMP